MKVKINIIKNSPNWFLDLKYNKYGNAVPVRYNPYGTVNMGGREVKISTHDNIRMDKLSKSVKDIILNNIKSTWAYQENGESKVTYYNELSQELQYNCYYTDSGELFLIGIYSEYVRKS